MLDLNLIDDAERRLMRGDNRHIQTSCIGLTFVLVVSLKKREIAMIRSRNIVRDVLYSGVSLILCICFALGAIQCSKSEDSSGSASTAAKNPVMGGAAANALSLNLNVTAFAGPAAGDNTGSDTDGTGNAARFSQPWGITSDGTNLYVADSSNHKIRKVVISSGVVTTIAGPAPGSSGTGDADGTGNAARFNNPRGITTDGTNLFVADSANHKIRKIVISSGVVTTLAGPAAGTVTSGDADGTGNAARFFVPYGLTTDGTNLFIIDTNNHKIRKIVISSGVVTTIAGPAAGTVTSGDSDGTGNAARFNYPFGITTDGTNLFVADRNNHKIRKMVISTGVVTTIGGPAPGTVQSGDTDATGNASRFYEPSNLTTDGTHVYITDSFNKIRKIVISSGVVSTIAGPSQGSTTAGDIDANGNAARFSTPYGITTDGTSLFVSDYGNNKIRKIN